MSDDNPTPAETTTTTTTETAAAPPWGDDFDAQKAWNLVQNLRADKEKLASREALTDDQKVKLAEYDSLVEASKTDAQRRDEELEKFRAEAAAKAAVEAENLRFRVALEKGLPANLVGRLQGSTVEEVTADADTLLALIKPAAPADPRAPKPNPAQGASGATAPTSEQQAAQAAAAGDWRGSLASKADQLLAIREQQTI